MTGEPKRATIRTTHADGEEAARIADAVRPDNTPEMDTRVEDSTIVTTIERETTGGLQSTADDYVVNLQVAAQLSEGSDGGTADSDTSDSDTADDIDVDDTNTDDRNTDTP